MGKKHSFKIDKPAVDKKDYAFFELPNKMRVLLIHDKEASIGQAALCVAAGSWNEPKDYPGLAHFLEHMLFQGSETYPTKGMF